MARMRFMLLGDIPGILYQKRGPNAVTTPVFGPDDYEFIDQARPSNPEAKPLPFQIRSQHIDPSVDQPLTDLRLRVHSLEPNPAYVVPHEHPMPRVQWTLMGYVLNDAPVDLGDGYYAAEFAVVVFDQVVATNRTRLWQPLRRYSLHLTPSQLPLLHMDELESASD